MSRLRELLRRDERGVTLTELIVTMALLGMVLVIVIGTFSLYSRSFTRDRAVTESATTATSGMNEVTRVVRAGTELPVANSNLTLPAFEYAGLETVTMYAYLDTAAASPRPVKVQFSIATNGDLTERRWAANAWNGSAWTFAATSTARVVARKIVNRGTPYYLFTYYKENGDVITPAVNASLTEAERRQIAAVRIAMTVQADDTGRGDPVALQNTVGIPNLGKSRLGASQ